MEQYRMDFAMQRGHEMLLDREKGIVREELDELELSMLQAAEVPRLLKMDWYDLDGHITFRYALAGKRMLSQRLQTGTFTMRQYYQLILAIVEAIEDCKHYMLRSEAILLHEHYMYVGDAWQDIGLAYMPLRVEPTLPVRERLTGLAVRWTVHVEQVDGAGLQRMLRELGHDIADWTDLRELLLELIALSGKPEAAPVGQNTSPEMAQAVQPQLSRPNRPAVSQPYNAAPFSREVEKQQQVAAPIPPIMQGAAVVDPPRGVPVGATNADADLPAPEVVEEEQGEGSKSRRTIVIGAIVFVASALVWRYGYMDTPTMQRALLCGGLTLLAAAAGYWGWRSADKSEEAEEDEAAVRQDIQDYEEEQSAWRWGGWERQQVEGSELAVSSVPSGAVRPAAVGTATWEMPDASVYPPPVPPTAAPSPGSEETVLLSSSDTKQSGRPDGAYLERLWDGRSERVPLSHGRFVIGRSGENAHYVDSSSGLSRSHLEILKENSGYAVKDLGSRNGSLLNGESMIPYKQYTIQSGDQLQLAGANGAVYTFQQV
ncbi:DUF6382 domain-containing protein [Paenibacillus daejeonensis]|uniref:DUF6382 domain-containing protein n=1 Tax=Paenibacillus daejeonensis TaxID=135193 RepID=UPI000364FE60|nr:DUF6382 domain-containing protein [Paenibacillus daejeonensis]